MSAGLLSVAGYSFEATDILGNARGVDGNGDGKGGWDMGAYEFASFKPPRFSNAPEFTVEGWRLKIARSANQQVQVQRSANLKDWENVGKSILMGEAGVGQITDSDTGPAAMFYRVVVP